MSNLGNKKIMANNIKYYMNLKGINQTELCNALGLKYMTVNDWVNAKSYPRIDKIEMMADYFGISKSDLVEERRQLVSIDKLADLFAKYAIFDSEENQKICQACTDPAIRRLVLFAGENLPEENRDLFVDAMINAIKAIIGVKK